VEHNTILGRLITDPGDVGRPGPGWRDLDVEALWPARTELPIRVRVDLDLARRVARSFEPGSLICVIGRRWVADPTGPSGQRFYLTASAITGLRPGVSANPTPVPGRAQGWTQITASGLIVSESLTVRPAEEGQVGDFVIGATHRSGVPCLVVRAPLDSSRSLRVGDLVRATGTLAVDRRPRGGVDDDSFHLAAERIEVLVTHLGSARLQAVTNPDDRLATVHHLAAPRPGVGL
jgi:hypothetical protein